MNDDELTRALAGLPPQDVDTELRERTRLAARAALSKPAPRRRQWYGRLEPVLLVAFCTAHLVWAFGASASLLLR